MGNIIQNNGRYHFIGGGLQNVISGATFGAVIGGGDYNVVSEDYTCIVAGYNNRCYSRMSFIGGGYNNHIEDSLSRYGVIISGWGHRIRNNSDRSFIGCGGYGIVDNSQYGAIVAAGYSRVLSSKYGFIGGGYNNIITGATRSSIIGGWNNIVSHADAHIIGSNITSISANTTHVENLNISTFDGGSGIASLQIDVNGMVVTGATAPTTYWEKVNNGLRDTEGSHTMNGVSSSSIIAGGAQNSVISGVTDSSSDFSGIFV